MNGLFILGLALIFSQVVAQSAVHYNCSACVIESDNVHWDCSSCVVGVAPTPVPTPSPTPSPTPIKSSYSNQKNIYIANQKIMNMVITFSNCANVWIENCYFVGSALNFAGSHNITVKNVDMIHSNGATTSHAILFNQCSFAKLLNSYFEEIVGQANTLADIVNSYKSNNVLYKNNYLIGGGGTSVQAISGGGLIFDNFGTNQIMTDNICVDCGNYGFATSGGINNQILNSQAYSKSHSWSNVAFYAMGWPKRNLTLSNVIVKNNIAGWINKNGQDSGWWLGPNVYNLTLSGNNFHMPYKVPPVPSGVGSSFMQH